MHGQVAKGARTRVHRDCSSYDEDDLTEIDYITEDGLDPAGDDGGDELGAGTD